MIRNSNIPKHWSEFSIGEILEFEYGKGLVKSDRSNAGNFKVYGSSGIVGFHNKYLVNEPCIIVGRKGSVGAVYLSTQPCWPIDTTYFVKPGNKFVLAFLFYQLTHLHLNRIEKSTAIPGLSRTDIYARRIVVPPIPEQQQIVATIEELFSELDAGRRQLEAVKKQLVTYRQTILKFAFEGKLTKTKFVESITGDIVDIINNGYTPSREFLSEDFGDIPFIKVYNLNFNGTLNFRKNPTFIPKDIHKKELKRSICLPGDVLINIVGPPLGKVTIVTDQFPEWNINQAVVMFRPNKKVLSKYLSYFLQNPVTINWLEETSKATAGQWNIKVSTCREIPIPICSPKEQEIIVYEIESRLPVCDKLEETIETCLQQSEALKQSILKQAFEGKLVKPQNN